MQLWLRIPLRKLEDGDPVDDELLGGDPVDSWETWNSFRLLCEHNSQLSIVLDVLSSLPSLNSLGRWFGEPVRAAILNSDSFLTNAGGHPCLSKRHQNLVTAFFNHSVQMDPLPEQEHYELGYRDFLQSPLQPLMDNLEAQTYETFEKDTMKYTQYQCAVGKALVDRVPDEKASSVTTVLMVVGAGRGPLFRALLQAAEETSRKLKVYAGEKNPNAVITLHVSTN